MFKLRTIFKERSGQATLVIVVIVMVVSLAVGVAASNRAISNIKRVSYTSQSDQALHCAESGAEVALNQIAEDLDSGSDPLRAGVGPVLLTDTKGTSICSYNYTVLDFIATSGGTLDYPLVKQDDVQEVNLDGYSGDIDFYFGSNDEASLELTFVKGSSAPYSIEKDAYSCTGSPTGIFSNDGSTHSGQGLPCGAGFSASGDYKIVRMRPLFADTKIVVEFSNDSPPQGYVIDSAGKADIVERKMRVIRTKPQLPAVFDYAIFSEGPLKKP